MVTSHFFFNSAIFFMPAGLTGREFCRRTRHWFGKTRVEASDNDSLYPPISRLGEKNYRVLSPRAARRRNFFVTDLVIVRHWFLLKSFRLEHIWIGIHGKPISNVIPANEPTVSTIKFSLFRSMMIINHPLCRYLRSHCGFRNISPYPIKMVYSKLQCWLCISSVQCLWYTEKKI